MFSFEDTLILLKKAAFELGLSHQWLLFWFGDLLDLLYEEPIRLPV